VDVEDSTPVVCVRFDLRPGRPVTRPRSAPKPVAKPVPDAAPKAVSKATPQPKPRPKPKPKPIRPGALLLTPGAGADRTHHTLVAVEQAVVAAAVPPGRLPVPAIGQAGSRSGAGRGPPT
jgi:hypothetical protein